MEDKTSTAERRTGDQDTRGGEGATGGLDTEGEGEEEEEEEEEQQRERERGGAT